MRGQRGASGLAEARHDVDHAVGQAGFQQQLTQLQGRKRRLFGDLQHHGAAGGQGRAELPGRHQEREVPRDDLAHHADRLGAGIGHVLSRRGQVGDRDVLAFELGRPAGHVVEHVGRQRHVGDARDAERLAVVQAFQLGQLVQVFVDQVADLVDDAAAGRRCHLAPRALVERAPRGLHRRVDVGGVAFGHARQQHLGGGVMHVEGLAGLGLDPLAVDQHRPRLGQPGLQRLGYALHSRTAGHLDVHGVPSTSRLL